MQQSDLIEFLSTPDSYGLGKDVRIQRQDTHISIVFLAGDFAFKLKRAIQLPFVDFRTLSDRQHFCKKEVEVNRRLSPKLYIGLVAVTRDEDGYHLDGPGEVVDWLVKMRRFDQSQLFDRLCEAGMLKTQTLLDLCEEIVAGYKNAAVDYDFGGLGGMRRAFDGHYLALDNCPDHVLPVDQVDNLKQRVESEIAKVGGLLENRRKTGMVRHCHGDLHLRNICFFQDQVTLFDAIEFEPDYAVIDVLYDLSFLLMDLCHRGRQDLANLVFNHYLALSGDVDGLKVLGLFLASRATIRTHVNAVASQNQESAAQRRAVEADARVYLEEALDYLSPQPARLVALGGLSGSGKSVLARGLAPHLGRAPGAYVARTDMIRKRLMGVSPTTRLGEEGYTRSVTQRTYELLYQEVRQALSAGYCVIVDGVFAKESERNKLERLAGELGVSFSGLWLSAPLQVLEQRVEQRRNDVSDAGVDVLHSQAGYDVGRISWHVIKAGQDIETVLAKSRAILDAGLELRGH